MGYNFKLDIDFKSELNAEQYAAVAAPYDKPLLVLAGAGSGKTRTLTYRVAWLLSECGLSPREILLLTFTNKAARQMLERIEALTGYSPNMFWGGTFHSVAYRFLRLEGSVAGLEPNFGIMDADDAAKLLKVSTEKIFPKFFSSPDNPKAKLLADIISYARNTRKSIAGAMHERFDWISTPYEQIEAIAESYEESKRSQNICDFDDLLELWLKVLQSDEAILERYSSRFKNVLVDEYQDTNSLQCAILELLAHGGGISAVGDNAQCIYSWRGADDTNILRFRDRWPNARIEKIELNYRSTPQILNFANSVIEGLGVGEEFKKNLKSPREDGEYPSVVKCSDATSQSMRVVDAIKNLVERYDSKYTYGDIAILYRANFQAMDLQLRLQQYSVPFVVKSGVKFFEQSHIKDVVCQIKFAANQSDFVSFDRFVRFIPKVGAKTAEKIFFAAHAEAEKKQTSVVKAMLGKSVLPKVPSAGREMFSKMAETLSSVEDMIGLCREEFSTSKPELKAAVQTDMFGVLENNSASGQAASDGDSQRVLSHMPKDMVRAVCEGWYISCMKSSYEDWAERCESFDALYEYASRYSDFDEFLSSASLEIAEDGADTPSEGGFVNMMTVHQAKGLEFPVVFVIGASDGLFPLQRCIDEGGEDEERRLFYVACTRAKDLLVITWPQLSVRNGLFEALEKSRFINDVPDEDYKTNC